MQKPVKLRSDVYVRILSVELMVTQGRDRYCQKVTRRQGSGLGPPTSPHGLMATRGAEKGMERHKLRTITKTKWRFSSLQHAINPLNLTKYAFQKKTQKCLLCVSMLQIGSIRCFFSDKM